MNLSKTETAKASCDSDHLAVALQKLNHHTEALDELTKAIEVSSIPKVHLLWDLWCACCKIACSFVGRRIS